MNLFASNGVEGEYSADRLGRIKVLLVGNTGCGKTCLAHLLSQGKPLAHATHPTIGCNVTLMVMTYPADRAKSNPQLANQDFFLELWDVGAHPRYAAMRGLFYQAVNGVVLVHDLTFSRSLPTLQRWAAEVSSLGSFAAPYSEDRASLNLGGLPVPCLVVGNKLDLVPQHRARYSHSWREQLWAALQRPVRRLRVWAEAAGGSGSGGGSNDPMPRAHSGGAGLCASGLPKETLLHGNLQASVMRGDIDMHAVTSFFCTLIERRYCPSSPTLAAEARPAIAPIATSAAAAPAGRDGSGTSLAAAAAAALLSAGSQRLSSERLPPVMYNAISEESSPYSSLAGSLVHTPFASSAALHRGSSGNLSGWLPPHHAAAHQAAQQHHAQHAQHQHYPMGPPLPPLGPPQQFPGVSVALQLQRADSGGCAELGGKGAGSGPSGRPPLFGGRTSASSLFGGSSVQAGGSAGLTGRIDDSL